MGNTNIDWADKVWNPVTGCTKVSDGCRNCYAERMAKRLAGRCGYPAENPFTVALHAERLEEPLRWKKPSCIFVCSMGDLFHEAVPDEFIDWVFAVMALCPQHTFMVLTKRPERMLKYMRRADWSDAANAMYDAYIKRLESELYLPGEIVPPLPNILLGTSVEDQKTADERIPLLLQTPAAKRFVSYEPAIGPVDFTNIAVPLREVEERHAFAQRWREEFKINALVRISDDHYYSAPAKLDWIIMGGESGPGARPMHPDWARSVRDQCNAAGVPFFFKQWGEWAHSSQCITDELRYLHSRAKSAVTGDPEEDIHFARVGKKAAGCLLDGREHKEMP